MEVEEGIDSAVSELEELQLKRQENLRYSEFIDDLIAGKLCPKKRCPRGGPNPCGDAKGCDFSCPIKMPERFIFITTSRDIKITMRNEEGEICGKIGDIQEVDENIFEVSIEADGCCNVYLHITKSFEAAKDGVISYTMPLTCN